MDAVDAAVLATAALAAGALNAVAGGGSFLTFPALVFTGVPPIAANATSALAVSPGYLGSTLGFRHELRALPWAQLRREALLAAAGGVAGALLLLVTPASSFRALVPWLLLLATALFAWGPWIVRRLGQTTGPHPRTRAWGLLAVAVYGGYFNGGLGILLMALLAATGETDLQRANALKNFHSLVLSVLSVATFALAGAIAWGPALLMATAATAGGYVGARTARRLPAAALRTLVVATGLIMAALFAWRG
ncbi:MAG: sulfite exporter TauE/SafE family protein [Tepidimonas sp.]|uniref:sulfite exporter TauE/SafE family protein n=1 Tax=Tepidimonas sp. TaxID=2002775 RepID=UPI00298F02FE|nr:sulfite exporter TauE/SafE family protein [Tepidimonas sp.]MDW8337277.1 sulfite exporter TauE/SafE family protein [Tepidimonas sp.]